MLPPLSLFSKTILSEETSLLPLSAPLAANNLLLKQATACQTP